MSWLDSTRRTVRTLVVRVRALLLRGDKVILAAVAPLFAILYSMFLLLLLKWSI